MAEAGGSVFANMPLIFAIGGVALGFTNNDGVSALAVVAYGIMVKTMKTMVRRWFCIYLLKDRR